MVQRKKIMTATFVLIIKWLNNFLIKSRISTYHLVTLNCSKNKLHNTAYVFEQIIYDRYEDKTRNIVRGFFNMMTKYENDAVNSIVLK